VRSTKSVGSDATLALKRMKTFKFLAHLRSDLLIQTAIENFKNKNLLNRNIRIYCEITRESTKRNLVFHMEANERITKEK